MASTKQQIERECSDCGTWTDKGDHVVRAIAAARVAVWVCRRCLHDARNWEQVEAAVDRIEAARRRRHRPGVVKYFRC